MKTTTICLAAVASLAVAGAAVAADLPRGPTPYYSNPAPSVYNWGGFYAGANLGYEWGKVTNIAINPNGIIGGLQAGYNWQSGPSCSAAKPTSRPLPPTTPLRRGSSPIPGSAPCAPAPATP